MMLASKTSILIAVLGLLAAAGFSVDPAPQGKESAMPNDSKNSLVYARVIGQDGRLTDPVLTPKWNLSDAEWKERLSEEQFRILRSHGTEAAFCGGLLDNKEEGIYLCGGCRLPLFASRSKFESGTGWPSFFEPVGPTNILERADLSHGMVRTEILCPRCESHLGHVFPDGPKPTGLRYCLNSEALQFAATADLTSHGEKVEPREVSTLVVAGGCFWCVEGVFREIDGVLEVVSGYSGGDAASANYEAVCSGRTGHAEAVRIVYDPKKIPLEQLFDIHFATHDPTTLNRQGNDVGPQYRSAVFYADAEQKAVAEKVIARLTEAGKFGDPIVTTLEPLKEFYPAEPYHQNYVCRNPYNPYVRAVSMPKVEKARALFPEALKDFAESTMKKD